MALQNYLSKRDYKSLNRSKNINDLIKQSKIEKKIEKRNNYYLIGVTTLALVIFGFIISL